MLSSQARTEEFKPAVLDSLILYVPTTDLEHRLGNDPLPLSNYIKNLEKVVAQCIESEKKPQAKGLLVAVGIKGSKKSRVWCEAVEGHCPPELLRSIEAKLAQEPAISLRRPPVAFGMKIKLWGQTPKQYPEFPKSWVETAERSRSKVLIPPDDLFKVLWPNTSPEESVGVPPDGFVTQPLSPFGGEIQKPKDWFYTESHRPPSYTWILSRENASKAAYTTGVRIQMIVGVKEKTTKTPKAFIQEFIQKKKSQADKIIKSCPETNQGMFTPVCLETEEGPHHILYSLFWGNDADLVVVSIAGTTKESWDKFSPVFDTMSDFKLLDPSKLNK